MSARVLVVEEQPIARAGILAVLEGAGLVVETAAPTQVTEAADRLRPEVAIVELRAPGGPGLELCRGLIRRVPDVKIVALASEPDGRLAAQALAAGVSAYVLTSSEGLDLADVVRRVLAGERVVDPAADGRTGDTPGPPAFSGRERDVLVLAADGMTNAEIATRLEISRYTVKEYMSNAMRKLEVGDRVAAVNEARRLGVLDSDAPTPAATAAGSQGRELRAAGTFDPLGDESGPWTSDPDMRVAPIKLRRADADTPG